MQLAFLKLQLRLYTKDQSIFFYLTSDFWKKCGKNGSHNSDISTRESDIFHWERLRSNISCSTYFPVFSSFLLTQLHPCSLCYIQQDRSPILSVDLSYSQTQVPENMRFPTTLQHFCKNLPQLTAAHSSKSIQPGVETVFINLSHCYLTFVPYQIYLPKDDLFHVTQREGQNNSIYAFIYLFQFDN